jgi:hypothetical protein
VRIIVDSVFETITVSYMFIRFTYIPNMGSYRSGIYCIGILEASLVVAKVDSKRIMPRIQSSCWKLDIKNKKYSHVK